MTHVRTVAFLAAALFASSAGAFTSQTQQLKRLDIDATGNVYVYGKAAWRLPTGCNSGLFAILPKTDTEYRERYAALLAAKLQEQRVQLTLDSCIKAGGKKRPVVSRISIR